MVYKSLDYLKLLIPVKSYALWGYSGVSHTLKNYVVLMLFEVKQQVVISNGILKNI